MASWVVKESVSMVNIKMLLRLGTSTLFVASLSLPATGVVAGPSSTRHPVTIDDVLNTVTLDRVAPSPDGEWVAAVVPRPAQPGEVFGRNSYEIDPSRNDVWLVSRRSGERRNLTQGRADAAGFWCATWSPDGQSLAMLSTKAEGGEPRGGDNVHLYVWQRADGRLRRVASAAMMTQGRYGSGLYPLDLRGGADGSSGAHSCRANAENAPFLWLDDHRLLTLMLPTGEVSALLDQYGRPFDQAAQTRAALRAGEVATATAVGSGAERLPRDEKTFHAKLAIVDVLTGATTAITDVPTYPFGGVLTLSVAPDRKRVAMLGPIAALAPARSVSLPYNIDDWHVEKRLGFVDLTAGAKTRWVKLPPSAKLPLELLDWSPDGRQVALRARTAPGDAATALFIATADTLTATRFGEPLLVGGQAAGMLPHEPLALWTDNRRLLVNGRIAQETADAWWLVDSTGLPTKIVTTTGDAPAIFRRRADGRLVTIADGRLMTLDAAAHRLVPIGEASLPSGASIIWPVDPNAPTAALVVASSTSDAVVLDQIDPANGRTLARRSMPSGELYDADHGALLWSEQTPAGLFLHDTRMADGSRRTLLDLDTHLASVDWGKTMLIDYDSADGQPLKAAVILPPGYRPGTRYPVLTWVYGGYVVRDLDDYWLDRYLPGLYNLQLYAAHGYVVMIPSMPIRRDRPRSESYAELPKGVLPAIDRLTALGIADPARIGVMGQSFGGYSVYGLVTQTNRFKAAIALAGMTDLAQSYGQFDPTARGYPGIEHEKSSIWSIYENAYSFGVSPLDDAAFYWRNSPIAHVEQVETPLLLIHGEHDIRDPLAQAETFFFQLYRQGKTAKLLRYWGENHSLAQSPANVRDIVSETYKWLDKYIGVNASEKGKVEATATLQK